MIFDKRSFSALTRPLRAMLAFMTIVSLFMGSLFTVSRTAHAAIPGTLGYQGVLKNAAGTAQTGTYSFVFRLYASSTGGTALWTETQSSVSVASGIFSVQLGSQTAFPVSVDFNAPLFLTTEVNSDGEMSPRIAMNAVGYAMTSGGVNSLGGDPVSATGGRMYYDTSTGQLKYYNGISSAWQALGTSTSTLQTVTASGNTTTYAIQFGGGTSTGAFNVTNTLTFTTATGTTLNGNTATIGALTSGNATINGGSINGTAIGASSASTAVFTNVTSTNVTSTNIFASLGSFTTLNVTNPLTFGGLLWTNATGTNTTSTNLFSTNSLFTNATATVLTFTTATGTTLNANIAVIAALTSGNATINGGSIDGTAIGTTNASTAIFTNTTSTNVTSTNIFATLASFTTLNVTNPFTLSGLTWTNATGTNSTSTFLNVVTMARLPSDTRINNTTVCLSDGTNCQASASADTLLNVTNRGGVATSSLTFYGGATTSNFTATGTASFQTITFTNATATNVSSTVSIYTPILRVGTGTTSTGISVPGAGTYSERFGASSTAGGANSLALGANSMVNAARGIGIGESVIVDGADAIVIGRNSSISSAGSQTIIIGNAINSGSSAGVTIGYGASNWSSSVAVGNIASAGGTNAVAVGRNTNGSSDAVAIGADISAGQTGGIVIGRSASNSGGSGGINSIVIGNAASASIFSGSIVLGASALAGANSQFVIGSATMPITDLFIGRGVSTTAPTNVTINATGGNASGKNGANLQFAGGMGGAAADAGGSLIFQTANTGTGRTLTNRLTIDPSGLVTAKNDFIVNGAATATSKVYASGLTAETITGSALCLDANGEVQVNTGVASCTVSSARFKHSIEDLPIGLSTVMELRPVQYEYNQTNEAHIGFIAEEIDQIEPRLVAREKDGTARSVRYDEITSLLTKAIQEQQQQIFTLQQAIDLNGVSIENFGSITVQATSTFLGSMFVGGQTSFGHDSVGQARILSGSIGVHVTFDAEYQAQPIVTITPLDFVDSMYRVTDITTSGFTIELNAAQNSDKVFNWHVFSGQNSKIFVSDGTTQDIPVIIAPSQPDQDVIQPPALPADPQQDVSTPTSSDDVISDQSQPSQDASSTGGADAASSTSI